MHKLLNPWIISLILVIPALLPFFKPTFFRVHDYTHVARISEMDRAFKAGQIPPRWSQNLGFGYGMPIFSFYAPLPYYIGVIFHWIGLNYIASVKILFLITFYLSCIGMFYLAKEFFDTKSSYFAATLFTFVPYRAVDVYVRGALGELWGILFIVVSLLCIVRLIKTPSKRNIGFTGLAIAGLLLSHNLMTIVGIPFILFFCFLLFRKSLVQLFISLLLGFGLASYFFIPAVSEKSYTSVDQLTKGSGNYAQHFVYLKQLLRSPFGYGGSIEGPFDGLSFEIGIIHLVISGLTFLFLFFGYKKLEITTKQLIFFCAISLLGSIFLMSFHSKFIWDTIPVLNYLQFPWRLLVVPMIVTPLMGAFVGSKLNTKLIAISIVGIVILYISIFKPSPDDSDHLYQSNPEYLRSEMSTVIPDYIHPQLSNLVLAQTKDIQPATAPFTVDEEVTTTLLHNTPGHLKVKANSTEIFTFTAHIFDFPGWTWWINGKKVDHTVDTPLPTMSFNVNAGETLIEGKLVESPIRLIADSITLGSIIVLGLLVRKKTA